MGKIFHHYYNNILSCDVVNVIHLEKSLQYLQPYFHQFHLQMCILNVSKERINAAKLRNTSKYCHDIG